MSKNDWISATSTHNYFKEPLLDWFKYANLRKQTDVQSNTLKRPIRQSIRLKNIKEQINSNLNKVITKPKLTEKKSQDNYLCTQGNEFEKQIIKLIYKKINSKHIYQVDPFETELGALESSKALETINCMKEGYHVILSGVLHDAENGCYGIPDILIRSDKINKIIKNIIVEKENKPAPFLTENQNKNKRNNKNKNKKNNKKEKEKEKNYHYRVIDIKFQTLHLRSDGETLLNSNHIPAYKSQLYVYNRALGLAQGYTPGQAYILGRRWVYKKNGQTYFNDNCFDKLGVIDYKRNDEKYVSLVTKALEWVKLCKSPEAEKWDLTKYPLPHLNLYPNMCNLQTSNLSENQQKERLKIAKNNHELTELWQVGKKHRETAINNGINNWMDKKLTSKKLGIGGRRGEVLDKIININRQKKEKILPKVVKNNEFDWKTASEIEFFVDFEFKNAVFDKMIKLPIADKSVILFTIGVGFMHPTKYKWVFKDFTSDYLNATCEEIISEDFIDYVREKHAKYNKNEGKNTQKTQQNPRLIHWSQAEPNMFNNVLLKNRELKKKWDKSPMNWCDLLTVFRIEPIVIKGCLNFKLKSVARALYNHGFISICWDDSITDGQDAMIETIKADEIAKEKNISMKNIDGFKNVLKYNEVDCKVLCEILDYIRNNHCGRKANNKKVKKNDTDKRVVKKRKV